MNNFIKEIKAREILDSRGDPTIEVDVFLSDSIFGRFAVPSGASTGEKEAIEIRDINEARYFGKGVRTAISNVLTLIKPKLVNKNAFDQKEIDTTLLLLDGTENKKKLGANAILGVSVATAKAAANQLKIPFFRYIDKGKDKKKMPIPMINILNGGAHANNGLEIQEFMIIPIKESLFSETLRCGAEVFYSLKKHLKQSGFSTSVGDEGGFSPALNSNQEALDLIMQSILLAGLEPGKDVFIAIDAAANEFYDKKSKYYRFKNQEPLSSLDMINFWKKIYKNYPLLSLEDGLAEHDTAGWIKITEELGNKMQLVGDDLFATNATLLKKGIKNRMANAILIKLNQIGTLTETLETINTAKKEGYNTIMSHRSGETEDSTIADLAVATNVNQIKTGSLSRSERLSKYNQLIRIEEDLEENEKKLDYSIFAKFLKNK